MDGFSVYKDYINNYKSSQETLLKCRNASTIFDNILQKVCPQYLIKLTDNFLNYAEIINEIAFESVSAG